MNGDGQGPGLALDGDLALLHGLEQGRLRLGRGPVDLVGQQEVGEHRPLPEPERPLLLLVDQLADDVGGHQVGGELQPFEPEVQGGGHGLDQQGLGHAGDALEQHVAADQQRRHDARDGPVLTHDDLGHLLADRDHGVVGVLVVSGAVSGHGPSPVGWCRRCRPGSPAPPRWSGGPGHGGEDHVCGRGRCGPRPPSAMASAVALGRYAELVDDAPGAAWPAGCAAASSRRPPWWSRLPTATTSSEPGSSTSGRLVDGRPRRRARHRASRTRATASSISPSLTRGAISCSSDLWPPPARGPTTHWTRGPFGGGGQQVGGQDAVVLVAQVGVGPQDRGRRAGPARPRPSGCTTRNAPPSTVGKQPVAPGRARRATPAGEVDRVDAADRRPGCSPRHERARTATRPPGPGCRAGRRRPGPGRGRRPPGFPRPAPSRSAGGPRRCSTGPAGPGRCRRRAGRGRGRDLVDTRAELVEQQGQGLGPVGRGRGGVERRPAPEPPPAAPMAPRATMTATRTSHGQARSHRRLRVAAARVLPAPAGGRRRHCRWSPGAHLGRSHARGRRPRGPTPGGPGRRSAPGPPGRSGRSPYQACSKRSVAPSNAGPAAGATALTSRRYSPLVRPGISSHQRPGRPAPPPGPGSGTAGRRATGPPPHGLRPRPATRPGYGRRRVLGARPPVGGERRPAPTAADDGEHDQPDDHGGHHADHDQRHPSWSRRPLPPNSLLRSLPSSVDQPVPGRLQQAAPGRLELGAAQNLLRSDP